jgi:hypothetical protein
MTATWALTLAASSPAARLSALGTAGPSRRSTLRGAVTG